MVAGAVFLISAARRNIIGGIAMPWLGDGTWVADANLARAIVNGRTNYRPWSGNTSGLIVRGNRRNEINRERIEEIKRQIEDEIEEES